MIQEIIINIEKQDLDFDTVRKICDILALKGNEDTMLISWLDNKMNRKSPSADICDPCGMPGWEAYGINRGGRIKFMINKGLYQFIYS